MGTQNFEKAKRYVLQRLEKELPPGHYYHCLWHTSEDVVPSTVKFAHGEDLDREALDLLLTAAWFHDLGFVEIRAGHEAVSVRIASEVLPGFGYSEEQIRIIKGIIMATVVPQRPITLLEQILADADLDVLGRDDFLLCNGNLRRELAFFGEEFTDTQWFSGQLKFMETHVYFTSSARALREAGQEKNVRIMKQKLEEINPGK